MCNKYINGIQYMFDIKEYYHLHNQNPKNIQHEIENINDDLSYDIDAILKGQHHEN